MKHQKKVFILLFLVISVIFLSACQTQKAANLEIKQINRPGIAPEISIGVSKDTFIVVPLSSVQCCRTDWSGCEEKTGFCPEKKPIVKIEP